jgi:Tol biopolymer transport system component
MPRYIRPLFRGSVVLCTIATVAGLSGSASAMPLGAPPTTHHRPAAHPTAARQAPAADPVEQLAFTSNRDGGPDIYVSDASAGATASRLTSAAGFDESPSYAPDGSRIAFTSSRAGAPEVFVMNADGTDQHNVTNSAGSDYAPAWSPDGTEIAFTTDRDGDTEVYAMQSDGSRSRPNVTGGPRST